MATNRILVREHEMGVQEESTFGTDPGAVGADDMFKAQAAVDAIGRSIARYDRDQDRDYQQASVLSTQIGRQKSSVSIVGDLIPSGNATTPTPPDMSLLYKAIMGTLVTATAHTTTAAGSSGVTLELAVGGGAASGIAAGDMIAVDYDGNGNYEVRYVVSISTDTVTMDRALTSDPGAGEVVKVGTTYKLLNTAEISLYLKRFLAGEVKRYAVPGFVPMDMELNIDFAQDAPVAKATFSGEGKLETTHSDSRPTPTTAGQALVPSYSAVWFGTGASPDKYCIAGPASLKVNNGQAMRENTSCSLEPSGFKRTGNNSRYMVEMALQLLATTGDEDTLAIYDALKSLTAQDVLVQIGKTPGAIVAWRCANWIPDPGLTEADGELGINFGGGRAYGTSGDDEVVLAFI